MFGRYQKDGEQVNLIQKTLKHEPHNRPGVWFMRQAGRCLPPYRKLREKYSFLDLMHTPDLAREVTVQPLQEIGVDAAILFNDILVIPEALGMQLQFTDKGPRFEKALKEIEDPAGFISPQSEKLQHVYDAIKLIREQIDKDFKGADLIGFAGAPLTVFCYMIEGFGSDKGFPAAVNMFYQQPEKSRAILKKIADLTIEYARGQVDAGIDVFQLFETWAAVIPFSLYRQFILPEVERILAAVRETGTPTIYFGRGIGVSFSEITHVSEGLGVDWQSTLPAVRELVGKKPVLQGNIDPRLMLCEWPVIEKSLDEIALFGRADANWVLNLGHGVLPDTDHMNLKRLVEWVKNSPWY